MASWDDVPNAEWVEDLYVEEPASNYESPSEPATDESGRATGTVKVEGVASSGLQNDKLTHLQAWRAEKRFGFIGREDGGSEYVFPSSSHATTCSLADIRHLACSAIQRTFKASLP